MRNRFAVIVVIVTCAEAYSCECTGPSHAKTMRDLAEWYIKQPGVALIFEGTFSTETRGIPGPEQSRKTEFSVTRTFRGEAPGRVSVSTTGECGYNFQIGHSYLVYASRKPDGPWFTSICSGTQDMEDAGAAVRLLTGKKPTAEDLLTAQQYRLCEKFNLSDAVFLGRVLERGFTQVEITHVGNAYPSPVTKEWQEFLRVEVVERFLELPADLKPFPPFREIKGEVPMRFSVGEVDQILRKQGVSRLEVGETYLFYFPADGIRSLPDWYPPRIVPLEQAPLADLRKLRKMTTASLRGRESGWSTVPYDALFLARVLKREFTEIKNPVASKAKSQPRGGDQIQARNPNDSESPYTGYEVRVAPIKRFRGLREKSKEVVYDSWDNLPTCGEQARIGETYLIFADYYNYYFQPHLFQKMDESIEKQVRECERKH